jgi:hypothetical protein
MLTIPAGWAVYFISRDNSDNSQNFVTRMINKYTEEQDKLARRNDLHVRMAEQAGEDRVLFYNTKPQEYVDMKFPEYVLPATESLSMLTTETPPGTFTECLLERNVDCGEG